MDQLTGQAGANGFFFDFEALDGIRIGTNVMDYEVGVDNITLGRRHVGLCSQAGGQDGYRLSGRSNGPQQRDRYLRRGRDRDQHHL
ncbi:hypothetical protein [Paracoccus benzoatiresistens]|uniref:Porin n=1 Tax=Paracoccus benzoatiresistens TaxID=2997341 RepID=A0ABT4JA19_9RHOB|nr:hypothetical protein [Paracoccus sp. EF6]MCZ0963931.1 hypothetical protein [Paracoccus sp. EF6]